MTDAALPDAVIVVLASLVIGSWAAPLAAGAGAGTVQCGDGAPAFPVQQFRVVPVQGLVEMWPPDFRPSDPTGQPLPPERDSTTCDFSQPPGQASGCEFFVDLEALEGAAGSFLYMAYNAGFQIWDVDGVGAASPRLVGQVDGWEGDFHTFEPTPTEFFFIIWDVAVQPSPSGDTTLLALAADTSSVGLTIWDVTDAPSPVQLYGDTSHTAIQVAAADVDGRSYAFLGSSNGVHVYDMTRAGEIGPCFEDAASAGTLCGGNANPVWRGRLEPWPWGRARYLDVLPATVGAESRTFLAASDAFVSNGLGVEIREITDVTALPPAGSAVVEGLSTLSFGVDLFEIADRYYLGTTDLAELAIYDVTPCITGGAGCDLFDRKARFDTVQTDFSYVQFSESGERPFLYKGFHTLCADPAPSQSGRPEYLLDLGGLATGEPVVEVRGESYPDPAASNREIDYWSSYYDGATGGFRFVSPHAGKFHRGYFYRAMYSLFDVHQLDVAIFADGFESGDFAAWAP